MPDYSKSKIYKIYNDSIPDKVYYGSTINTLVKRLGQHKDNFSKCTSKQLFPNAKIVLVEKFPCNDKDELTKRERWYIENNECVNKYIPGRTQKEWREDNKDKVKKEQKKYYETNKDKLKKRNKQWKENNKEYLKKWFKQWREDNKEYEKQEQKKWREDNKEKIKEQQQKYYETNKEKIKQQLKQYREDNKDKLKEKKKQYYETNKDKMKEIKKEKIGCKVCKSMVSKGNFDRHCKSKKHQSNLGHQGV